MVPTREYGDTCRLRNEKRERFKRCAARNRPPEYGSHRPLVGAAKHDRSAQTGFAFATIGAQRFSALQTGREGWGYCGCRFLAAQVK